MTQFKWFVTVPAGLEEVVEGRLNDVNEMFYVMEAHYAGLAPLTCYALLSDDGVAPRTFPLIDSRIEVFEIKDGFGLAWLPDAVDPWGIGELQSSFSKTEEMQNGFIHDPYTGRLYYFRP
jgi:hypothetical protein